MRCLSCYGSGTVMGGGMIYIDCPQCIGFNKIIDESKVKPDKRSSIYRDAVNKIAKLHNVDVKKAAAIFDDEFSKIED